jgi:hypothetical protein
MWDRLGETDRATFVQNAPTWLDEARDPAGLWLDAATLAASDVPLLLTHGTESPPAFGAVTDKLKLLAPGVQAQPFDGAGHAPQRTHPEAHVADISSAAARSRRLRRARRWRPVSCVLVCSAGAEQDAATNRWRTPNRPAPAAAPPIPRHGSQLMPC